MSTVKHHVIEGLVSQVPANYAIGAGDVRWRAARKLPLGDFCSSWRPAHVMVPPPGLEPGRVTPLEPKSSASTNSATAARREA